MNDFIILEDAFVDKKVNFKFHKKRIQFNISQ